MKKWWAKLLLVLGIALAFGCVVAAIFCIRSKNTVDAYKDQLRAAGEKLDVKDLIPPRPDPARNGATLVADASRYLDSSAGVLESNEPIAMRMVALGKATAAWQETNVVTLYKSGLVTNSWDDVEKALQAQAHALDLLRQAVEYPQIDFGLDYRQGSYIPLMHLAKLKAAAQMLSYQTADALHRGNSAEAVTNIHTLVSLINEWNEPIQISQLVRFALTQVAMSGQWGLLQATNLAEEQLALLQRDWSSPDFVTSMENSLTMERAWTCLTIEQLRTSNSPSAMYTRVYGPGSTGGSGDWLADLGDSLKRKTGDALWRVSWSYSDELTALKGNQVLVETIRQVRTNGYFKDAFSDRDRKLAPLGLTLANNNWLRAKLDDSLGELGAMPVESGSTILDRLLAEEAVRRITVTSIALKRYQLRHGQWPADLKALVPEFLPELPRDPVDGQPLRYKRNPDETFTLYSIGKDGVDNGGDPIPGRQTKSLSWQLGRDWVWPQPATAQEVQNYFDHPPL